MGIACEPIYPFNVIVLDEPDPNVTVESKYADEPVSRLPVMNRSLFVVACVFELLATPICVYPPVPGAMTRVSFAAVVISTGTPWNKSWPAQAFSPPPGGESKNQLIKKQKNRTSNMDTTSVLTVKFFFKVIILNPPFFRAGRKIVNDINITGT